MRKITNYGASTETPQTASSLLLAKARTYANETPAISLNKLPSEYLAAAAILADLWCAENHTEKLDQPNQYGTSSTQILTAIYLRVLNNPVEGNFIELQKGNILARSLPDKAILRLQEYQKWVEHWRLSDNVLLYLANDLSIAPIDSIYASYALAILDMKSL
jgi:hypothetical protein